jgi:hypothetical protein
MSKVVAEHQHRLSTEVAHTVDRVTSLWDGATARMAFIDVHPRANPRAVLAWPAPQPPLSGICSLFEHFGLRVPAP